MVAFLGSRPRTSAGPRSRTAFSSACVSVTSIRVVKLRQVDPRPDWLAPRRRCIRCSHSLGGICSGGWGMQDASSAWRACRSRHRGGDRAAFVKPPGLTPRGTATRTAGVSSMPTNFLEHQRAPGNGVVDHGAMPAGVCCGRRQCAIGWLATPQLAGARLGALTFP